jgi:hypothetical protein
MSSTPEDHWEWLESMFEPLLADINKSLESAGASFSFTKRDVLGPNMSKWLYIQAMHHGIGHGKEEIFNNQHINTTDFKRRSRVFITLLR